MGTLANRTNDMAKGGGERTLAEIIRGQMPKIMAVAPKHLSGERMYQLTISTINREPKLGQCDVASLLGCVMKCSALGLEPSAVDGLGRAYILPFRNKGRMEATFVLGYKGMLDLARRSGQLRDISARAVYEGDDFDFAFGLDEHLSHRPMATDKIPAKLTHVYMVAHFTDGGHYMDVMTRADVEAVRKRSKSPGNGPWVTDYEAMAKKTVIRRAFPYLPVSVEAQEAATADDRSGRDFLAPEPVIQLEAEAVETVSEPEPEQAAQRMAACTRCGNVVSVAADAELADLAQVGCCDAPGYEWMG